MTAGILDRIDADLIEPQRLAGGGYLLTRWNLSKELPDLAGAEALLARMGVFL